MKGKGMLLVALTMAMLTQVSNAVYFYAQKGKWRCFADTVVKNNTLEMEVQVMDKEVLGTLIEANDELILQGRTPNQGVRLSLSDKNGTTLFYGDVHPNVQYEYEAEEAGEYKLCVQLTESAFERENQRIKTKVKFSAEFHRNRRIRKERERGFFDGETSMVDGTSEYGNFHEAASKQQYDSAATEGSFEMLSKRINKISTAIDTIIDYQTYLRNEENSFRHHQEKLASSIFSLTILEILLVMGSAAYSVYSLRKFFVKKHIM